MSARPATRSRLEAARWRMYRDLVFESAEHVFAEKGFDQATMQEIASEAGISLKTLYAHYPGKNDLYAAIQEVRGQEFVEQIREGLASAGGPLGQLAGGVRAYVEFLVKHPAFLRIHLREGKAWALRPSGGGERGYEAGLAQFEAILKRGMQEGVFHTGDPELLAMMGIALMQVPLARLVEAGGDRDAAAIADEILVALQRLLCKPGARAH